MRNVQCVVRRVILPLRQQFLDELAGFAPRRSVRSPLDYKLEPLERRIVCAAGDLDPTFGNGGLVFPPAASASTVLMNTGADGSIVVGTIDTLNKVSHLMRYTPDGQMDAGFGDDGVVTFEFTPDTGGWGGVEEFADLIVMPNGKIVALGNNLAGNSTVHTALHAFNADGSVDTSFGDNGVVLLDNMGWPQVRAGADGRIFLFGAGTQDGVVVCLNGDGSIDTTFGDQGRVRLDFGAWEEIRGAALGPNGEILVALSSEPQATSGFHVIRLTPAGQFDPTFGQDGKAFITRGQARILPDAVRVMSDGRIVVLGAQYDPSIDVAPSAFATRLHADGSLDTSFGDGGTVATPRLSQLEVQADGKLVFAGTRQNAEGTDDTVLARLSADGSPDESFGEGGMRVHDFYDGSEGVSVLRMTASGDILMAGTTNGALTLRRFDAGELSALPPAEPEPARPPAPQAGKFSDVQPVGDVEEDELFAGLI